MNDLDTASIERSDVYEANGKVRVLRYEERYRAGTYMDF